MPIYTNIFDVYILCVYLFAPSRGQPLCFSLWLLLNHYYQNQANTILCISKNNFYLKSPRLHIFYVISFWNARRFETTIWRRFRELEKVYFSPNKSPSTSDPDPTLNISSYFHTSFHDARINSDLHDSKLLGVTIFCINIIDKKKNIYSSTSCELHLPRILIKAFPTSKLDSLPILNNLIFFFCCFFFSVIIFNFALSSNDTFENGRENLI